MKRQAGFTLVEIAIVLVVIGLLLGGVLKGQELVLNSQIRNAINEYNNVASAMFAYQDRYRQIPGDDDTAGDRWNPDVPNDNTGEGDSDGTIDGDNNYATGQAVGATDETGHFWLHLRNDRLIVGDLTSRELPTNSFDGSTGVQDSPLGIIGLAICHSNIQRKPAEIIDTRIDDGAGDLGTLRATADVSGAFGAAAEAAYADQRHTLCREL